MIDDSFEWDAVKAETNRAKHKLSFEDARLVFFDAFAIERTDTRRDYAEKRSIIVGMAKGRLLTVVYTERNDRIRIISARKAGRRERNDYYQNQTSE